MRECSTTRFVVGLLAAFCVGAIVSSPAQAQEGAITGTVTNAATAEPLDGAQVLVVGTGLGTLTGADGTYRIPGVPAGEHQVRVQLIGYQTRTQRVSVTEGQAATADFALRQSAVRIEQIVVTGTGTAGIQQKTLGNTIGVISTDQLDNAPTASVTELLTAREPGLSTIAASGMAAEGQRLRIRGASSLSQSNEPVIYVDGVRMGAGGGFAGAANAAIFTEGTGSTSRLDDLDPEAIERIEVLKGAAAATLYGSEASNGVIQIFTKSGREGEARWNVEVEAGIESMPTNRIVPHADFARNEADLARMKERWDEPNLQLYEVIEREIFTPITETGRNVKASGSVSGGGSGITYFASSRYSNVDGIFGMEDLTDMRDVAERWQSTGRFDAFPSENLKLSLSTNYAFTQQQTTQQGNSTIGAFASQFWAQLRLADCKDPTKRCNHWGSPGLVSPEEAAQIKVNGETHHFRTSLQTQYNPSSQFSLSATGGIDVSSNESFEQRPFGWNVNGITQVDTRGRRNIGNQNDIELTVELRGGWDTSLSENVTSRLTVGSQSFLRQTRVRSGTGVGFGGPGLEVAGAAGEVNLGESITESVNVGVFGQEQIGYRDFAFLTVGGRWDVNSAFGKEVQGEFYPKASASLVFSDLPGWDSQLLSTLRVRGAWGQSGLQPSSFARFRTFAGTASRRGPGVEPQNLGNPDIKPEVTTEYEAGVNLGLLNDRLSVEGSWWTRTTNDALIGRKVPPSGGFTNPQLENIAQMDGHGFDFSVNAAAVQKERFSLDVFAHASFLDQTVTDMGGVPPIRVGGASLRTRNFIKEGFAPGDFFGAALQRDADIPLDLFGTCQEPSREAALDYFSQPRNPSQFEVLFVDCGKATRLRQFKGSPWPDWEGSFGMNVSFLDNFHVRTVAEYKLGQQHHDQGWAFRQSNRFIGRNTPRSAQVVSTLENPASSPEERLEAAIIWAREMRALEPASGLNQIWDSDFVRLRETSITYDVPSSFASRLSVQTLSVSFRARNLAMWVTDEYPGLDPELEMHARCAGGAQAVSLGCNFEIGMDKFRIPIPRRFLLAVSAGF